MNKSIFISLTLIFFLLPIAIWSQTDNLGNHKVNLGACYIGFGGGPCTRGGALDLSFTMASSNYWGGSINFNAGMIKSHNVPSDYYDDGLRVFSPKDYFNVLSFNFLKKFKTSTKSVRFGLESGPSWVRYKLTEFEPNPNYGDPWWPFPQYKYYKSHVINHSPGLSFAVKAEFPFTRFFGLELTFYTVVNNIQSVIGFNICLNAGKLRN